MSHYKPKAYSSLGGLERAAMIAGMPLMGVVASIVAVMALTGMSIVFVGSTGIFFVITIVPCLVFLKKISLNDDQGVRMFYLESRIILKRIFKRHLGKTYNLSSNPSKGERNRHDFRRSIETQINAIK
jgi:type IV secretory pathway VirB3-like protein